MLSIAIFTAKFETDSDFLLPAVTWRLQLQNKQQKMILIHVYSDILANNRTYVERQQKLLHQIEVFGNGEQLMNNVFNTNNTMFTQMILNQFVGIHRRLLAGDSQEAMFENQITHRLDSWIAKDHIWFDYFQQSR